ncbi:hypothetical protein C8R46DRAFT_420135 [Mycena filopes]|nr:hypothetical protein C8R46DRAFT_420135 [Mycena filopes]
MVSKFLEISELSTFSDQGRVSLPQSNGEPASPWPLTMTFSEDSSASSGRTTGRPSSYLSQACENCQRRKIRCDGERPVCRRCRLQPPRDLEPCRYSDGIPTGDASSQVEEAMQPVSKGRVSLPQSNGEPASLWPSTMTFSEDSSASSGRTTGRPSSYLSRACENCRQVTVTPLLPARLLTNVLPDAANLKVVDVALCRGIWIWIWSRVNVPEG